MGPGAPIKPGFTLPTSAPLVFIRFSELPDLDFIARHGLSESATVPAPPAGPAPARTGATTEVRACLAQGTAAAKALQDRYAGVQGQWFGTIGALRRDPATVRALRKDVPWRGKTVYTGVSKETVAGPRMVRRLNIDGDGQGDLGGHGGEQRAVLAY